MSQIDRYIEFEAQNGVRFSWNTLPMDAAGAAKLQIPIAALYTPFKMTNELPLISTPPVLCGKCSAILNCHARFKGGGAWTCPFCHTDNPLSNDMVSQYNRGIMPVETRSDYYTVEYTFPNNAGPTSPIFLFVVDTAISADELNALRNSLLETILLLPPDSVVGLISFGRHVYIHELTGYSPRSFVFNGDSAPTRDDLSAALNLAAETVRAPLPVDLQQQQQAGAGAHEQKTTTPSAAFQSGGVVPRRFLSSVKDCDASLSAALTALKPDPYPYESSTERPARATGAAIAAAVALLDESSLHQRPSRILLFAGGVCTTAPGCCAGRELSTPLRSHRDIFRNTPAAAHVKPATEYYEKLADRARTNGHVIDLFVACLDQVGLLEMRSLALNTGGHIVLDDSFTRGAFRGSIARLFAADDNGNLMMAFGTEFQVQTTRELQVVGMLGPGVSGKREGPQVARSNPHGMGVGGTYSWVMGGVDETSTVAVFFDVTKAESLVAGEHSFSHIQFTARYRLANGTTHLRVTTVSRIHADTNRAVGFEAVVSSFDQEAAAVVMARWVVFKTLTHTVLKVNAWLDRLIIAFFTLFAQYRPMVPDSFKVPPSMDLIASFLFYLRRSQFLQIFNNSPDETTFFRSALLHETVSNAILMIQPTLVAYSLEAPAGPVPLDVSSCDPRRILVLDTFFHVVIWYGSTIHFWRMEGMQNNPEHGHFAQLLKAPVADARQNMVLRFPAPRFIECVEGGSQSRFLMARVYPSNKRSGKELSDAEAAMLAQGAEPDVGEGPKAVVLSDDSTYQEFRDMIKSVVVSKGAPPTFTSSSRIDARR